MIKEAIKFLFTAPVLVCLGIGEVHLAQHKGIGAALISAVILLALMVSAYRKQASRKLEQEIAMRQALDRELAARVAARAAREQTRGETEPRIRS
jgi:hypothetical protein